MGDLQAVMSTLNEARSELQQCIKDYADEEKSEGDEEKTEGEKPATPRDKQPQNLKDAAEKARAVRLKKRPVPPDENE